MASIIEGCDTACSAERLGFLPVAIETLTPSNSLPFDLFLRADSSSIPVLYREQRLAIDSDDLSRLAKRSIRTLYIRVSEHVSYRNYLQTTVLRNPELSATQRFNILQVANHSIFHLAFHSQKPDMLVKFAAEYGDELASVVCDADLVLSDLLPLMTHDYYTYTHATNVCTLALIMAVNMGMRPADGIVGMASAVLLHDLGKRRIAPVILNQRRPLNPEQKDLIRKHPTWGFQELCGRHDVLESQLLVIYQHHERWDGRGYPVGLVSHEIHPWARICAVADAYDTMLSARHRKSAISQSEIWELLDAGCNKQYDCEMVKCLKSVTAR